MHFRPQTAVMTKPLPRAEDLISYDQAVAGHDGVMSDVNHILFIKPCTPAEAAFYETSVAEHPEFAELMPTFMGRLDLAEDQAATIAEQGAALIAQCTLPDPYVPTRNRKIATNVAVVLENIAHGYKHPNILDVKLGVRLWADDAHQDKKTRFDKVTQETTHKNLGFRIAGMRVWQGHNTVENGVIDKDGYKIYDKEYGKQHITDDNISEAFRNFFSVKSAGMDEELSKLVMQAFLTDLDLVQQTLESQESRMYSSSLLFVFEGDGEALRAAMEEASNPARYSTDNSNGFDKTNDEDDDEDDDEDEGPKIYTLKVIDFAHAFWTPGQGPDENALFGIRNVKRVLEELGKDT